MSVLLRVSREGKVVIITNSRYPRGKRLWGCEGVAKGGSCHLGVTADDGKER